MLAEGMHFTRSRKKYLLLLFAGSVVMNIGKYFFSKRLPVESIVLINNVFGTLLITGLYIVFYDLLKEGIKIKSVKKILGAIGLMLVPIIIS
jgi:activator of 2-hydroxyglutaryl-CoA dehydratase